MSSQQTKPNKPFSRPIGYYLRKICSSEIAWRLLVPAFLIAITMVTGFSATCSRNGAWKSTGLLIGETSYQEYVDFADLNKTPNESKKDANAPNTPPTEPSQCQTTFLWIARLTGFSFLSYAVFILLFEQLRGAIRSVWVWSWAYRPCTRDYALICGLGWKGREIALSLIKQSRKVAIIEKDPENPFIAELRREGAAIFLGNATDLALLKKAGAKHAKQIYIVAANDELNCRITQQIESLLPVRQDIPCHATDAFDINRCTQCQAPKDAWCYVAIEKYQSRIFLENRKWTRRMNVHCFNTEELIVRDLFRRQVWPCLINKTLPNYAFYIFGDTPMAREIVVHILRSLHVKKGQLREITVFCAQAAQRHQEFLEEFPCLKPDKELAPAMRQAVSEVFPQVSFLELPKANSTLLDANFPLYQRMIPGWQTHAFFCLDDGVQSQILAELIQPRFYWLKNKTITKKNTKTTTDFHIHVYYNYPEDAIQSNASANVQNENDLPARFGGYSIFCKPETIAQSLSEKHAAAIDAYFHASYPSKEEKEKLNALLNSPDHPTHRIRRLLAFVKKPFKRFAKNTNPIPANNTRLDCYMQRVWERRTEWERESNRQAADHIPVKLAILGINMDHEGNIQKVVQEADDPVTAEALVQQVTQFHSDKKGKIVADAEELPVLAEIEHRRWCAERLLTGWIPIASKTERNRWLKDSDFRETMKRDLRHHADLVPFDALPENEKSKDYVIIAAIPLLLKSIPEVVKAALEKKTT